MNVDVSGIDRRESESVGDMTMPPDMIGQTGSEYDKETLLMAMIVCLVCKHMVYSPVDGVECDSLVEGGLISRHCHRCGAVTSWVQFEWRWPDRDMPLLYQTTQPDRI